MKDKIKNIKDAILNKYNEMDGKAKKKLLIILGVILVVVIIIVACAGNKQQTLEQYFEEDSTLLDQITESTTNEGLSIDVEENMLIYTYDISTLEGMTEALATSDQMVESLQSTLDESEETFADMCADLEENSEIDGISILVRYNYKKEVIASKVYKAA